MIGCLAIKSKFVHIPRFYKQLFSLHVHAVADPFPSIHALDIAGLDTEETRIVKHYRDAWWTMTQAAPGDFLEGLADHLGQVCIHFITTHLC